MKAGAVCVAFADDTGDVSHTETFTMHRIEKELQEMPFAPICSLCCGDLFMFTMETGLTAPLW